MRGRMEISGPTTAGALTSFFQVPASEIEAALSALEAEGFILRGKFHPGTQELEWCDRRLLARIHRLTINRLRAEIQPVSIAQFQRFLLSWQRVDLEKRAEGPEGVHAVLEMLEIAHSSPSPEIQSATVMEFSAETKLVLDALSNAGALFFGELVKRTGLLPSRLEQALAELVAAGWATSDSFEGLRALLLP